MAVNKLEHIPINRVVAKPFIGPVPNVNNTIPAIAVVIFASNIADKALEYLPWR